MRLLLDTHVLLWAALEPDRLAPGQRDVLEDGANQLFVSAATAWEIATKWRLGKLQQAAAVVHNYGLVLDRLAATELPIRGDVARRAGLWAVEHRDPFDRLLAAQAAADQLILVSSDPAFGQFEDVQRLS